MPIRPENRARYPDNWPDISLRIRTIRAGGRCECRGECLKDAPEGRSRVDVHLEADGRCGAVNGQPLPSGRWRVVLTVAHLDHTPENCSDENLKAMCQPCHLRLDSAHHAETRRARVSGDPSPAAQMLW